MLLIARAIRAIAKLGVFIAPLLLFAMAALDAGHEIAVRWVAMSLFKSDAALREAMGRPAPVQSVRQYCLLAPEYVLRFVLFTLVLSWWVGAIAAMTLSRHSTKPMRRFALLFVSMTSGVVVLSQMENISNAFLPYRVRLCLPEYEQVKAECMEILHDLNQEPDKQLSAPRAPRAVRSAVLGLVGVEIDGELTRFLLVDRMGGLPIRERPGFVVWHNRWTGVMSVLHQYRDIHVMWIPSDVDGDLSNQERPTGGVVHLRGRWFLGNAAPAGATGFGSAHNDGQ
jgi:hypothetical protein